MVEVGMMLDNIHFHTFETKNDLTDVLSQNIAKNLQDAINKNGHSSLIVSGGSTPKQLFEKLRQIKIEWEKITVGLCDERLVAPTHDDSNEKLVKTDLLQEEASKAKFINIYTDGMRSYDVLILGMGSDGHTASLFPNNTMLKEGLDLDNKKQYIKIKPALAPHMRISLTLSEILSATHLYLHFEGEEKLSVFKEALKGKDIYTMPIRSILHQNKKDVEVYYA